MNKILFSALLISFAFVSGCKKDDDPTCPTTVAGIAANYKITKVEIISNTGNSDVTNTFLDACKRDALYQLKSNNDFTYTEIGSSCTDSGNGSWSVADNKLTIIGSGGVELTAAPITSWNCNTLVVTDELSGPGTTVNYRFTFVKQ